MVNKDFRIALIKGDGIGIDVIDGTLDVIGRVSERVGGYALRYEEIEAGAALYERVGFDIEPGGEEHAAECDAILLGAIGLPAIRMKDGTEISPHLRLRENLQLYAGMRPIKAYPNSPRRLADPRSASIDLIVLRESTEGLFYSAAVHNRAIVIDDVEVRDIMRITRNTTEKLHDFAFRLAEKRRARGKGAKVTCVDKANVFQSQAFFRKIFDERAEKFPNVEKGYNYVDAQALDLIRRPWEFDILVMENMFGDIISDLAGGLVGGMGMASCAEIGDSHGLFQPAHGSAPDIMGQDKANPLAAILSGALMLEYLSEKSGVDAPLAAATLIEKAVDEGFRQGRLRPMEFGGDMGTKAIVSELISVIDELDVPKTGNVQTAGQELCK